MIRLLLQRLILVVPTLLLASFAVFMLLHLVPGDTATALAGEQATAEQLASLRETLGLNDPFLVQCGRWLWNAVQLDLGDSLYTREGVVAAILRTLPTTLHLVVGGLVVSILLGVPAGVASALRARRPTGAAISSASSLGVAVPSFWLGLILVSVFSLRLDWFPATGFVGITSDPVESLHHVVLPSIALGLVGAAEITRQLRAVMIEVLSADFIRTHRAKGLPARSIVWRHAMRNCAVSLITIIGLQVNRFLGATIVVESVFGIAGIGSLVVSATQRQDLPLVQGVILALVVIVVFVNMAVDLLYQVFDPRIR